jgi:hypothetical protein
VAKKLENMSDDEFMDAWTSAAENLDAAKQKVLEFAAEQRRRDAVAKLDEMSDEEKQHLAQYLSPVGIESEEQVNG